MRLPRVVLLLFLVAQAYDGLFTYMAVRAYGVSAEGNVLLGTWMTLAGPGTALLAAKVLASFSGVLVYVRRLDAVLALVTGFYLVAAIGPWLYVYATWP